MLVPKTLAAIVHNVVSVEAAILELVGFQFFVGGSLSLSEVFS